MRTKLPDELEAGRVAGPKHAGPYGKFRVLCPALCRTLSVMASDGRDWLEPLEPPEHLERMPPGVREHYARIFGGAAAISLPLPAWEHVSVSASTVPSWAEMCWVKNLFWLPDEVVMQIHPAQSNYVNVHDRTLHLWRPVGVEIPLPPLACV